MTVAQILQHKGNNVISVSADATVTEAITLLKQHRIGAVLVTEGDGAIIGVVSERDVVRALPDSGGALLDQPVSVLMTRDVITCSPKASAELVMSLMTEKRIRHLPVIEGGKLCGMITIGDVVKSRIAESENEAEALKSYIALG